MKTQSIAPFPLSSMAALGAPGVGHCSQTASTVGLKPPPLKQASTPRPIGRNPPQAQRAVAERPFSEREKRADDLSQKLSLSLSHSRSVFRKG